MNTPDLLGNLLNSILDFSKINNGDFIVARVSDFYASILGSSIVWDARAISLVISIAMLVTIVYLNIRLGKFKAITSGIIQDVKTTNIQQDDGPTRARWDEILRHGDSTKEAEWKFAIIEADKLMDDTLRKAGFPGVTMGERLMSIPEGQLQSLQLIWEAHKIRNRLAHDSNYFLRHAEAKKAIQLYGRALEELRVI
jgi:hypothetical protein